MLLSALENNCKSPVRTFLVILRNPLWSSSAANCSPIATNDVRDKEQQLLDTWLCESVFFKACPQSCGQAVTLNIPFVWAHFWGIGALGLAGLKQFVPSLDLRVEHCGERGREQALPHCVTLGSSRAALSFCSQLCAAASLCFLSALQANGFYWDSLLVRNLCRASVCCLNQSEGGGVASILPEHFSLPGASCPSLCLAEMEHLSSGQPWCGQGAQGSSLWVRRSYSKDFLHFHYCHCQRWSAIWDSVPVCQAQVGSLLNSVQVFFPLKASLYAQQKAPKTELSDKYRPHLAVEQRRFWSEMQQDLHS